MSRHATLGFSSVGNIGFCSLWLIWSYIYFSFTGSSSYISRHATLGLSLLSTLRHLLKQFLELIMSTRSIFWGSELLIFCTSVVQYYSLRSSLSDTIDYSELFVSISIFEISNFYNFYYCIIKNIIYQSYASVCVK
jgi:hypothetical protein